MTGRCRPLWPTSGPANRRLFDFRVVSVRAHLDGPAVTRASKRAEWSRGFSGMDAANVRRDLRRALALVPGLDPHDWTPRELRHSFVSLLSDAGVPVEQIAQLVGHSGTNVTELVYRHQIRPVIQTGATIMDRLFGQRGSGA
jgi:integrase